MNNIWRLYSPLLQCFKPHLDTKPEIIIWFSWGSLKKVAFLTTIGFVSQGCSCVEVVHRCWQRRFPSSLDISTTPWCHLLSFVFYCSLNYFKLRQPGIGCWVQISWVQFKSSLIFWIPNILDPVNSSLILWVNKFEEEEKNLIYWTSQILPHNLCNTHYIALTKKSNAAQKCSAAVGVRTYRPTDWLTGVGASRYIWCTWLPACCPQPATPPPLGSRQEPSLWTQSHSCHLLRKYCHNVGRVLIKLG